MDVDAFLEELRASPGYRGQIAHVHEDPARPARYADPQPSMTPAGAAALAALGVDRLYTHQAEAIEAVRAGGNVLITTGTASGKSLCYLLPIVETLARDPDARALLLFPTKALAQDQHRAFRRAIDDIPGIPIDSGIFDGDTPSAARRRLRNEGRVLFSNPDMIHAALMPQHARWEPFLAHLRFLVLDELHVYNGIFGANMANLLRRLDRVCAHYGSRPSVVACSATVANPEAFAHDLTGREMLRIDNDGSPRGRRVTVFWNPPRIRATEYRSRRSANVEAHELMAALVRRGAATIAFSKAKMTAEMIHRYAVELLRADGGGLAGRVTAYRGGYRPEDRRRIEQRLFSGELLGVSATRALELGIDVGSLDAAILVGYPGMLASFFQQGGRAGRTDRDALVILIGLDTAVNQYVMRDPDYIFRRPVEEIVVDPDNPFVILGHLRCATHELPLPDETAHRFGPDAGLTLAVLESNRKVRRIGDTWYHAAGEIPHHEVTLRDTADRNVVIQDVDTGEAIGQVNKFDAPPILHPGAVYLHQGDTYLVLDLDLDRCIASVRREDLDYFTQPLGGTDVHHVDARLREKPFGTGHVCWGEVTAYFETWMYERIRFYELDAVSRHGVELPRFQLETMAVWIIPPESLMDAVRDAGLDVHSGLRGIGYATRILVPLFVRCDTWSFSHSVGSANSPWNAVFIYERHPLGLGYTRNVYDRLHEILPAVREHVRACECADGCPRCVGKPLRGYATWDVQRGEANVPSKPAVLMILDGLIGDGADLETPDEGDLTESPEARRIRLEQALRRRLERMREPSVFHPIEPRIETGYPAAEDESTLETPDVTRRADRRRRFRRELDRRLAKHRPDPATAGVVREPLPDSEPAAPPRPSEHPTSDRPSDEAKGTPADDADGKKPSSRPAPTPLGDSVASRARKRIRRRSGADLND